MMGWASFDMQHFVSTPLEFIWHVPDGDAKTLLGKMPGNEI